jgi:hypothetical protein
MSDLDRLIGGRRDAEWDPETPTERPGDRDKNMRLFEDANRASPSG